MVKLVFKSDGAQVRFLELTDGKNRLGRGPANDVRISDPSVSTFHCEITVGGTGVWVVDLGSTNGSFIDERPIQEEILKAGQTLRLGEVRLVLETNARPEPVEPEVSIPPLGAAPQPVQKYFQDGLAACLIHEEIAAGFKCARCGFAFCEDCVRTVGISGGKSHFFCPECDSKCLPIEPPRVSRSFSERVTSFFGRIANLFKTAHRR